MDIIEFNEKEVLESLNRSGYLLESRISKILSKAGFDVQTNQVIKDTITGKNREIDLIAQDNHLYTDRAEQKCFASIRFVFEIKNNAAPLVLLTNQEYSFTLEYWNGIKEYTTIPKNVPYETYDAFYNKIITNDNESIFTQYCSFQRKKANDELMALHPEVMHDGLAKITQYCEEKIRKDGHTDDYLRHWIYLPVLLIRGDLYELHNSETEPVLKGVEQSILVYNYHNNDKPEMAYVFVVTEKGFKDFINNMLEIQDKVELEMIAKRKAGKGYYSSNLSQQ